MKHPLIATMLDNTWEHNHNLELSETNTPTNGSEVGIGESNLNGGVSRSDTVDFGMLQTCPFPYQTEPPVQAAVNSWDYINPQPAIYKHTSAINLPDLEVNPDADPTYDRHQGSECGNLRGFDCPMCNTSQTFPSDNGNISNFADLSPDHTRSHTDISIPAPTYEAGHLSLKKRKTSKLPEVECPAHKVGCFDRGTVLQLLFKYTHDLTMTQIENIAHDMGNSPEYVFKLYRQYRQGAKPSSEFQDDLFTMELWPCRSTEQSGHSAQVAPEASEMRRGSAIDSNVDQTIQQKDNLIAPIQDVSLHTFLQKLYYCDEPDCISSFSRQGDLNRHMKKHRPGEYICKFPGCGKMYYRKDKLRQHWEKEHKDNQQPAELSSIRSRKDHDKDGNSRPSGNPMGGDSLNLSGKQHSGDHSSGSGHSDTPDGSSCGQFYRNRNWSSGSSASSSPSHTDDEIKLHTTYRHPTVDKVDTEFARMTLKLIPDQCADATQETSEIVSELKRAIYSKRRAASTYIFRRVRVRRLHRRRNDNLKRPQGSTYLYPDLGSKSRYSCHKCQAYLDSEESACHICGHEICRDCLYIQPNHTDLESGLPMLKQVQELDEGFQDAEEHLSTPAVHGISSNVDK